MQHFNFSRLLRKYNSEVVVMTYSDGYYDDKGDYVKGEKTETKINGAVISFKESKVYRSDGTLTARDKRLFTQSPIDNALKGGKAVFCDNVYNIEDCTENAEFTGVYAYTLKFVSAFKDGEIG